LKEIEARKHALVAESEVFRQTLTLEIQNLRLYSLRVQRKFASLRLANPLLLAAGTLFGARFIRGGSRPKRRGKWSRLLGASLMGWRLYRQFGPPLQTVLLRRRRSRDKSSQLGQPNRANL
jgi:hypothetical protein